MTSTCRWCLAIAEVAMLTLASSTARAANLSPELDIGDRIAWAAPAAERSAMFDGCEMVVLAKQGRFLGDDDLGDAVDRVYASRVALDGTVKDPMGVPLELDSALGASNGGEIVTIENAPGLFGTPANSSPSFARLGGDLKILGRRVLDEPWVRNPLSRAKMAVGVKVTNRSVAGSSASAASFAAILAVRRGRRRRSRTASAAPVRSILDAAAPAPDTAS